jgi:hypothetical protein
LSAATERQIQVYTARASGAGFKEDDARALAEERLVKQITDGSLDACWKAILTKPQ